jgi:hypothetical protein
MRQGKFIKKKFLIFIRIRALLQEQSFNREKIPRGGSRKETRATSAENPLAQAGGGR